MVLYLDLIFFWFLFIFGSHVPHSWFPVGFFYYTLFVCCYFTTLFVCVVCYFVCVLCWLVVTVAFHTVVGWLLDYSWLVGLLWLVTRVWLLLVLLRLRLVAVLLVGWLVGWLWFSSVVGLLVGYIWLRSHFTRLPLVGWLRLFVRLLVGLRFVRCCGWLLHLVGWVTSVGWLVVVVRLRLVLPWLLVVGLLVVLVVGWLRSVVVSCVCYIAVVAVGFVWFGLVSAPFGLRFVGWLLSLVGFVGCSVVCCVHFVVGFTRLQFTFGWFTLVLHLHICVCTLVRYGWLFGCVALLLLFFFFGWLFGYLFWLVLTRTCGYVGLVCPVWLVAFWFGYLRWLVPTFSLGYFLPRLHWLFGFVVRCYLRWLRYVGVAFWFGFALLGSVCRGWFWFGFCCCSYFAVVYGLLLLFCAVGCGYRGCCVCVLLVGCCYTLVGCLVCRCYLVTVGWLLYIWLVGFGWFGWLWLLVVTCFGCCQLVALVVTLWLVVVLPFAVGWLLVWLLVGLVVGCVGGFLYCWFVAVCLRLRYLRTLLRGSAVVIAPRYTLLLWFTLPVGSRVAVCGLRWFGCLRLRLRTRILYAFARLDYVTHTRTPHVCTRLPTHATHARFTPRPSWITPRLVGLRFYAFTRTPSWFVCGFTLVCGLPFWLRFTHYPTLVRLHARVI